MRRTATRHYEMFIRVHAFAAAHPDVFGQIDDARNALATIGTAITQIHEHAMALESTARSGSAAKQAARQALEDRLAVIDRTARAIAVDTPGFDGPFRRPHRRRLDQTLLLASRSVLDNAERLRSRFMTRNLSPSFVEDLRALVDTFEETLRSRDAMKGRRAGSKAMVAAAMKSAFAAVRTLDSMIQDTTMDPQRLAMWRRTRRVEYPRKKKTSSTVPPAVRVLSASVVAEPLSLPDAAAPLALPEHDPEHEPQEDVVVRKPEIRFAGNKKSGRA